MRVFRKLHPLEQRQLRDHLLRLDREDRRRRFVGGVSDAAIAERCRRIDWLRTMVIGFFEDGVLRGAAELSLEDRRRYPPAAELALSVESAWQDQGIGSELVRRTLLAAANRGIVSVQMLCLAENQRIQRIAIKHSGRIGHQHGELEAAIAVPLASHLSLVEEAVSDGIGLIGYWTELAPALVALRPGFAQAA
jgi:GNAT superfamily N-acetyltransferase